jgi:hypothetical protein
MKKVTDSPELTDPIEYRRYCEALEARPWPVRLYDLVRDRQERLLLARRGGRYGILVRDDREAIAWRRLERIRGRVLKWLNKAFQNGPPRAVKVR